MGDGLSGAVDFFCVDAADELSCFPRCLRDRQWQWQRTFPLTATLTQTGGSREETAAAAVPAAEACVTVSVAALLASSVSMLVTRLVAFQIKLNKLMYYDNSGEDSGGGGGQRCE